MRISTFAEPAFAAASPTAPVEAAALKGARIPLPPFAEAARAQAIFVEEVQLTVLGRKEPKAAIASVMER